MPQQVKAGLIQLSLPQDGVARSVTQLKQSMIDKHLPYIAQAAKQGIQILGLQELFYGPYFCPSQSPEWFQLVEPVPAGPTTQLMQRKRKSCSEKPAQGQYLQLCYSLRDCEGWVC